MIIFQKRGGRGEVGGVGSWSFSLRAGGTTEQFLQVVNDKCTYNILDRENTRWGQGLPLHLLPH